MSADKNSILFRPFDVKTLHMKNRVVMAPMTRDKSPGGVPGADVAEYYRKRAAGGVGLIITEGTTIDHPAASGSDNYPRFHGADALAGWAKVVEAVHAEGGLIAPQLWHVGMMRNAKQVFNPDVPSVGPKARSATSSPPSPRGPKMPSVSASMPPNSTGRMAI